METPNKKMPFIPKSDEYVKVSGHNDVDNNEATEVQG